jgi:hypothetical protein
MSNDPTKRFRAALIRYADAHPTVLDTLASTLYRNALSNQSWAMLMIAERLDGKAATEATITHIRKAVAELTDEQLLERLAELRQREVAEGQVMTAKVTH